MGVQQSDNPNLLRAALDAGIVHLDTGHIYSRGRNEEMIGGVIKGRPRDSFVIATKVKVITQGLAQSCRVVERFSQRGPFVCCCT